MRGHKWLESGIFTDGKADLMTPQCPPSLAAYITILNCDQKKKDPIIPKETPKIPFFRKDFSTWCTEEDGIEHFTSFVFFCHLFQS